MKYPSSTPIPGQWELTFGITVGVHGMVGKSNFVSFPGSIHYKICKPRKTMSSAGNSTAS